MAKTMPPSKAELLRKGKREDRIKKGYYEENSIEKINVEYR